MPAPLSVKGNTLEEQVASLQPPHRTYIAARVRGKKHVEAAELAGISERTGYRWEDQEWFRFAADQERRKFFGDKLGQLQELVPLAVARLGEEIAGVHGDELAHASAIYTLDQVWGKAQANVKTEVKGDAGNGRFAFNRRRNADIGVVTEKQSQDRQAQQEMHHIGQHADDG